VPTTFVGAGNMRFATTDGKKEPIGNRIIELPEDAEKAELRDGHSSFVAYVPKGSIAKGEELATTGGDHVENGKIVKGKTVACGICTVLSSRDWAMCRTWQDARRFIWCGSCTTSSTPREPARKPR
jgi:hypothetical protein